MGGRGDRQVLRDAEDAIRVSDEPLSKLFAMFNALSAGEAMPQAEQLGPGAERHARQPVVRRSATLAVLAGVVFVVVMLTALFRSSPCTNSAASTTSARTPALRSCETRLVDDGDLRPGISAKYPDGSLHR